MVVLDGHNMLGTGPNQYLQPDYLSPLPTTLDAKKSPLALLAQTCSQIGADSPNTKSLLPSMDSSKRKSSTSSESSSINFSTSADAGTPGQKNADRESVPRPRSSSGGASSTGSAEMKPTALPATKSSSSNGGKSSPAFKPYESVPVSSSKAQREENANNARKPTPEPQQQQQHHEKSRTPSKRPSSSPNETPSAAKHPRKSPHGSDKKSSSGASSSDDGKSSPKSNNDQGASPIIRSGLEVLHGHGLSKDAFGKPGSSALSSLSALASHYPPGFDPTNPANRPPFFAPPSAHHFMGGGYPPSGLGAPGSPYVSYTRVKTPSGAETIVPVCKDPYCQGCSLSMPGLMANAAAAFAAASGFPGFMPPGASGAGGICPAGCAQCDHQKYTIPGFPGFLPPGMGMPPTSSAGYPASLLSQHAQAQAAAAQQQQQHAQRPYICNWIVADTYCGKRFPSSDELLQHLRTHTNNMSTSEASNLSAMTSPSSLYSSALLSSQMSAAAAAMHRTYPTPPLSPHSAARYNPFGAPPGKPGGFGIPTTLSSLIPHPQSLANYYSSMSPYALYGQRIGPPVHP